MSDGNGFVQIAEDSTAFQWSYLLLSISDITWIEIYSFCECYSSWSQAIEFTSQYNMRSQSWIFVTELKIIFSIVPLLIFASICLFIIFIIVSLFCN